LIRGVYKQAKDFQDLTQQLNIDHAGPYNFTYRIIPALEVFNKIGYENLYNAYFKGIENFSLFRDRNRTAAFNTLWTSIEYFNHTFDEANEKVTHFITENARFNEMRNMALGKAQEIIEGFRIYFNRKLELKEPLGVFYGQREQIIKEYHSEDDHTLPRKTEAYVQKILQLNRDNVEVVQRYENDIHSVKLNSLLLESSLRYENMKNHIESYNHYFNHLSITYFDTFEKIKWSYAILNGNIKVYLRYRKAIIKLSKQMAGMK
jgi:hypothetical protein